MHFKIAKSAQSYFNNIMNLEGSHAAEDKNKFIQFDVYYCCALIGMAAGQIDEDTSELKDLVERYPVQYRDCKAQIAGLLVASEARRLGIDTQSPIWTGCMSTKIIRGKALHLRSATNWSALQPERRSQRTPPLRQSLFSCIADTASCASRK